MSLPWRKSLLFWTAHGIICAAPSFVLAFNIGHNTPAALSAMLTGVAILILIYTWLSINTRISVDKSHGLLASSIRWAAHLRASFGLLSLVGVFDMIGKDSVFGFLRIFMGLIALVDMYTGATAKNLVNLFVSRPLPLRKNGVISIYDYDPGFFPTLLDTLVTGVLFSVIFVFIVIAIRGVILVGMRVRKIV